MRLNTKLILVLILFAMSAVIASADDYVSTGFSDPATITITVGTSTAVIVGTLPAGKQILYATPIGEAVNFGGSSVGTGLTSNFIASGTTHKFENIGLRSYPLYFRGRTATVTVSLTCQ